MRLLLISNMYPGSNPYFGIYVKRQVEMLRNDGIEIRKAIRSKNTSFAYIAFMLRSMYLLLFGSYDLVHAHYGFHSALIPALIKRKPLITTFHGSDALREPFRNALYYLLQKFTISRCDYIIAVSNDIKNTLIRRLSANPEKICVISCGVNTSTFLPLNKIEVRKNLGIAEHSKVVLSAGRLTYMKGVDVLYQCAQAMPNVLFVLVGDGPLSSDMKNCKLVGPRGHEEMPMWMNAADVFVLASRSEGTPVVLLEALSCGIPVISSNVGGCPDIVKDGQTGFLVPIENASVLQEKIMCLLDDDERRTLMGIQGRKNMIDEYDHRKIAERIGQIYKDTISSRQSFYGVQ